MSTMKEIAHLAGVSRGTVDRVFNNRGLVKPDTEKKIREIAKSLNYSPNIAGKNLAVRKKKLKFGYVLFGDSDINSFFAEVIRGIKDRASELSDFGVTVEIRISPPDEPEWQLKCIDELMQLGISALAITPITTAVIADKLKKLTKTGFPVVTANIDIADCGRLAYVGSNYIKSGEIAAGLMHLITKGEVNIGIISGSPEIRCHYERVAGFTEYSKKHYRNFSIIHESKNNDSYDRSYSATLEILKSFPQINALYITGAGSSGVCDAVLEYIPDRKIPIICYDATPLTCRLLKDGVISATITQEPVKQGAMPLDILLDYLNLGAVPKTELNYTDIEIMIKESL